MSDEPTGVASPLRSLLDDDRVHVMDGAMGTLLYSRGVFMNVCYDELNLNEGELVRSVHREYVDAGAELLETNTFGANPLKLSGWGLDDRAEEINEKAARLAREAANGRALVLGAMGPLGVRIEPWGPTARDSAREHFGRQVDGLAAGGVHGFILETFSDPTELEQAFRAVRERSDLPIFAQMTVGDEGETTYGTDVETIARTLTDLGADVVGLNCSVGPAAILDAVERMASVTDLPISAQPNAGLPRTVGDRKMYLASPDYVGQYARRLIEAGVRFVGGCCGTTPDHIQSIRGAVAGLQAPVLELDSAGAGQGGGAGRGSGPENGPQGVVGRLGIRTAGIEPATPLAERSRLGGKLARGEFATSVEIVPPKGWSPEPMLAAARRVQAAGADTVSVTDSAWGRYRMGALTAGPLIQREAGMEALVHYPCRNRSMMGMISDLLGGAASGIRNVLLVSGDLLPSGPYPEPTAGADIDSVGLTNVVHHLNGGLDPGGGKLEPPTEFVIGVVLNHGTRNVDAELRRFDWKVEAGADFAVTQPLFDPEALDAFLDRTGEWAIPVVVGLWPLTSARNAEFLANEVPNLSLPDSVVERMQEAQSRGEDAAEEEGVRIAVEALRGLRHPVAGVHVSAPNGRVDLALQVLAEVQSRATPAAHTNAGEGAST